jgi:hypothetical protein
MFIRVEVFNLLQVNNTVCYTWVTDVTIRQYAVPNYLTRRQFNLKLQKKFKFIFYLRLLVNSFGKYFFSFLSPLK